MPDCGLHNKSYRSIHNYDIYDIIIIIVLYKIAGNVNPSPQ